MEDLVRELMQGGQQPSQPEEEERAGDPLAALLQGMMGGQTAQQTAAQAAPGSGPDQMELGGLLQGLLGGAGGLTGGAGQVAEEYGAQAGAGSAQGGLELGGLLQGLLGGTGQASTGGAGGLAGILGALMGGGSSSSQSDSFLAPIATGLAEKLGLPPQIAQAVVAFVLGKLLGSRLQPGMEAGLTSTRSQAALPQGQRLDGVVQKLNSGKRVTKAEIRSTGLAKELAANTGLDRATAEVSLQEVLNALGGQPAATSRRRTTARSSRTG